MTLQILKVNIMHESSSNPLYLDLQLTLRNVMEVDLLVLFLYSALQILISPLEF